MLTIAEQNDIRARRTVKILPMFYTAKVSPEFVVALLGPVVMAQHALPAPEADVEVDTYRGWSIRWESGFGFSAVRGVHVDDMAGYCDTVEEIRAEVDEMMTPQAHHCDDTPALDDTFHRIEMDVD